MSYRWGCYDKAEIINKNKAIINLINGIILTFSNDIPVEGHTDNRLISNYEYKNNWQISSTIALNLLEYFVGIKGQAHPKQFIFVACYEF